MNKLLIGITSYNRVEYTEKCLQALEACENISFDVIIADNNSKPEVKEWLKQYDGKVLESGTTFKVLFLDKNYGVGKALNRVLEYRDPSQHFMKLDNDVVFPSINAYVDVLQPNCIFEMVDFLENNEGLRFKSVAGYFYDRDRKTHAPIEQIKTSTGREYEIENPHGHMLGAVIMWHNSVMNILKTFSEDFVYGYEDTKFSQASLQYGENAWARWLNPGIKHIDRLNLDSSDEILNIKKESLSGRMKVPK